MRAVGICGSDISRIFQTGTYSFPTVPGHEFLGVVAEVGTQVDKSWLGCPVGIFPLIPCMECAPCRQKAYELCRHYSYLGSRTDGGGACDASGTGKAGTDVFFECIGKSDTIAEAIDFTAPMGIVQKRVEPEKLITHLLSFEELQQGLEIMQDKREEYVKIMVKI